MGVYESLKKAIQELENDKKNNPIVWIAQFNAKDDKDKEIVKIGIRKEGYLIFIYFDFDENDSDGVADTREEVIEQIKERWGWMNTFKWISK